MRRFTKIKSYISVVLAALFLSYYAASTMFSHTHIFSWGVVTHSHPYIPQSSHSHSAASCSLIEHLMSALLVASLAITAVILYARSYDFTPECEGRLGIAPTFNYGLRAPPVLLPICS